jgi:heavy metal sensor kinase
MAWYVGTVVVVMAAFSLLLYHSLRRSLLASTDDALRNTAQDITAALLEEHDEAVDKIVSECVAEKHHASQVQVLVRPAFGPAGQILAVFTGEPAAESLPLTAAARAAALRGSASFETYGQVRGSAWRMLTFAARDARMPYVIQVGMSLKSVTDTLRRLALTLLVSVPLLLAVLALFGYFFIRSAFQPVRRMVATVHNIRADDLSRRVTGVESPDELGELAATFNAMLGRIERAFDEVRQFSSDAAHELKTPLTALRGEMEVALRKEREPAEYRAVLESGLEEAAKLERIVDDLLLLARTDAASGTLGNEPVALDEVVLEAYEETRRLAERMGISLVLNKLDEVGIRGNALLLKRLLVNLIDNGIKYNRPGGNVSVALELEGGGNEARLVVEDTGIGIPAESLPHLFDRFYRVDKARSRDVGGTGLGLAIVERVAEAHGGKVTVESKPGVGSRFAVVLPLAD